jgi:hypothetical protein
MPMTMPTANVNIAPIVQKCVTLSVRVHGVRRFEYRMRLARYWCKLGAWLIGCQFCIDSGRAKVGVIGKPECEEST